MKYYIDTCVWIDFVEGRTKDDFIARCIEREDNILYSYPLEKELLKHMDISRLNMIYALLSSKGLMEYLVITDEEKSEAFSISESRNIPFADALHAILARNNDAILITRDKHFMLLTDVCRVRLL